MTDLKGTTPATEAGAPQYAGASAGSVSEQLRQLKQELDQKEGDLSVQSKQRDALKADFTALEKSAGEVNKSPDDYEKARPSLIQDKKALEDYHTPKYGMVKGTLGSKVDSIKSIIAAIDGAIKTLREEIPKQKVAVTEAAAAYEAAAAVLTTAQKNFEDLKNLLKSSQDNIKKMQGWRKTIEEFDDKNDAKSMYVYLRELKYLLDATRIRTKDKYQDELEQAWTDLNDAKDEAREAQAAWDTAKNALAQASADLVHLEENRVKDILEKIKDV